MDEISLPYSVRLQLLRNEIEKAWWRRTNAIADFDSIIQQVPGMIPTSDGSFRIPWARAKMSHAIAAHGRAVKRYVDFVTQRAMKFGEK